MEEEQNASIWLIIIGILQLNLEFLSFWWGFVLIAVGIVGLFYHSRKMILIFGILLITAGFSNILVIIDVLLLDSSINQLIWAGLGIFQIYWGIKEINIFKIKGVNKMGKETNTSKILGIIGLSTGWLIPLVGITLGIIGLSIKKGNNPSRDIALNILSIISGLFFWIFWIVLLI